MTPDPIGLAGGINPWTAAGRVGKPLPETNLYLYTGNNPVNYVDPSGLDSLYYNGGYLHWLNDQGMITNMYPAMSGPYGNMALPAGNYTGTNLRKRTTKRMVCGGKGWSLDLEPDFPTNRTDLRIHPDQAPPGTAGCIGISCSVSQDLYDKLNSYFSSGSDSIEVRVRYQY